MRTRKCILALMSLVLLVALASCGSAIESPADVNWEECLVCESVNGIMTVTGVTDLGKEQKALVIPASADGVAIQSIAQGAFSGCQQLKTIYINADANISYLNNGAFQGAISLTSIVIHKRHSEITVSSGLMDGAASGASFYVPDDYYSDYVTDYQWGAFSSRIQRQP